MVIPRYRPLVAGYQIIMGHDVDLALPKDEDCDCYYICSLLVPFPV